jgi:hypothetical protein
VAGADRLGRLFRQLVSSGITPHKALVIARAAIKWSPDGTSPEVLDALDFKFWRTGRDQDLVGGAPKEL